MDDYRKFHSRGPVVETQTVSLCTLVDPNDSGRKVAVPFEEEIHWVRECEATVVFRHGGHELKEGSTYIDFYGFLTSIESAVKEAEGLCASYGVNDASSLEIAVIATVNDTPAQPSPEEPFYRNGRDWLSLRKDWLVNDEEAISAYLALSAKKSEERFEAARNLTRLERREVVSGETVWSSKAPVPAAEPIEALRKRVAVPEED